MINIKVPRAALRELQQAAAGDAKTYYRDLSVAINKTRGRGIIESDKQIRKELNAKAKVIKKSLSKGKKSTHRTLSSSINIHKKERLPLRDFAARQINPGVSYRISKQGGRKLAKGAFQGTRPGLMNVKWKGRVFKRKGKSRLPIVQLRGASPWGAFKKQRMKRPLKKTLKSELWKQILRRAEFRRLKRLGMIPPRRRRAPQ